MSLTTNLPLSTNITLLAILGYKKLAASLKSFRWYNTFGITKFLKSSDFGSLGFFLSTSVYTSFFSAAGFTHFLYILGFGIGMWLGLCIYGVMGLIFGSCWKWFWSKR